MQAALATIVLWFAGRRLAVEWDAVAATAGTLAPEWWPVIASAAIVLLTYVVLIETWRRVLGAWGGELRWPAAAHIWFVSSLGRYAPGKVWQIGAMAALSQRAGVSPLAATGSSILVNLVNLLAGAAVILSTGVNVLRVPGGAVVAAIVLAGALLSAPVTIPWLVALASRLTGRDLGTARVPARSILVAFGGCVAGWVLYGAAFHLLARGTIGAPAAAGSDVAMQLSQGGTGGLAGAIAVYTASYLAGYVAIFAPGGIVVREAVMIESLTRLGFTDYPHAAVLAVVSRLWITVLEVTPGLAFLARSVPRASDPPSPTDAPH